MKTLILTCVLAATVFVGCSQKATPPEETVWLYAGAGMRRAVDALVQAFEKESGMHVEVEYGGSGTLLSLIPQRKRADVFMPGDVWYVDRLNELHGSVAEKTSVAWFVPVVIVSKRESTAAKNIQSITDFSRSNVRLALGDPKACQVGRITGKILKANGIDPASVAPRTKYSMTVNELATWVKMGNADAAIVWDAVAANVAGDVRVIEIPKEKNILSHVVAGRLSGAQNPKGATAFIQFMASPKGQAILHEKGFRTTAP